ncbi:septal ring lytic transglycosylase RlpA family protein [Hoylesella pleuritidis]|jgi:rare lipoprotein A|uniref:septal ring lytic transglycosylase RlpA family protein n=1 Tax=Hoylesella pleuritidis TaxID=407975 RepID=UPI0028ECA093|nr:septal ring lytic transglycosylase RlpA family protein [Hoylesella pleuritidis]
MSGQGGICSRVNLFTRQFVNTFTKKTILVVTILLGFIPMLAQQRGKASFYSKRATGARTSSGERVHHDSLTCAHRTYPFGTLLRVRNLSNGKEVVVKVIDRGPFGRGRIIDLSWGAAQQLGMLAQGVTTVEISPVTSVSIPYRNDSPIKLPEIDFEVSTAGYSFIDAWRQKSQEKKEPADRLSKKLPKSYSEKHIKSVLTPESDSKQQAKQVPLKKDETNKWLKIFEKSKH